MLIIEINETFQSSSQQLPAADSDFVGCGRGLRRKALGLLAASDPVDSFVLRLVFAVAVAAPFAVEENGNVLNKESKDLAHTTN